MKHRVPVEEFTSPGPYSVTPETPYQEILKLMDDGEVRHIPVLDGKEPVGMISDRDLKLVRFLENGTKIVAKDLMSGSPFLVSNESPLDEVALEMSRRKIGSAIVMDASGNVSGIFTATDALNALVEVLRGEV
ncbi:MAG: CBS domain-containing protein [Bdellovibrionales bacterium]|nr:CBS domain-containing protein [Bdellovibrionales bacterium]